MLLPLLMIGYWKATLTGFVIAIAWDFLSLRNTLVKEQAERDSTLKYEKAMARIRSKQ